jgi:hypothetical protein
MGFIAPGVDSLGAYLSMLKELEREKKSKAGMMTTELKEEYVYIIVTRDLLFFFLPGYSNLVMYIADQAMCAVRMSNRPDDWNGRFRDQRNTMQALKSRWKKSCRHGGKKHPADIDNLVMFWFLVPCIDKGLEGCHI